MMKRFTLVGCFVLLLAASAASQSAAGWPTEGWKSSTPAEQGMDAELLRALDAELASGKHGYIDGMLVVRNGYVVYETSYTHDYDALFEGKDPTRGPYNYYDPDWHPYYEKGPFHTMQLKVASTSGKLSAQGVSVTAFRLN